MVGCICGAAWMTTACDQGGANARQVPEQPRASASRSSVERRGELVVVPQDSPQFRQLRVEPVQEQAAVVDQVVAPGRVEVNPNRLSRVVPPVQGRVLEVRVKLGDFVERGQPLLSLESPDAEAAVAAGRQAEAAERQANSALIKAEADYARAQRLYAAKAMALKDVLSAENDLVQARGAREATVAGHEQAERKLAILGLKPNDFGQPVLVRAPLSGKILEINVAPGEYRGAVATHSDAATAPLFTIADLSTLWISSEVPEPALHLIHVGEPVEITLVAFPGETFRGRVARMADTLDPQTRTLKVHTELPNPQGRFRPEMFGSILHAGVPQRVPVIPPDAVIQEYGHAVVFVEHAPGQFERRVVALGPRNGASIPVLDGLRAADRIVVDGAILLKDQ